MGYNIALSCFLGGLFTAQDEAAKAQEPEEAAYDYYIEEVHELEWYFAQKMAGLFGMGWSGTKHGLHETIDILGMDFEAYRRATIDEARALMLFVVDDFMKTLNQNEALRPFLVSYAFENTPISISFSGAFEDYSDGTVSRVSLYGGEETDKLCYYTDNPYIFKSTKIFEETYREAKERDAALNLDPSVHATKKGEEEIDELLYKFRRALYDDVYLSVYSIGAKLDRDIWTM
jgi:hypothetical protein